MQKGLIKSFEDLEIWEDAIELTKQIYVLTESSKLAKDFGLRNQMRRASISISSNIAEGFEAGSKSMFARYLRIARASAGELRSQLYIVRRLDLIDPKSFEVLRYACIKSSSQINKLINRLSKK